MPVLAALSRHADLNTFHDAAAAAVAIMPLGLECHAALPTLDRGAKLDIGMQQIKVELLIGKPVDVDSHETGKRHITFYFCGDTQRRSLLQK